LRASTSGPQRPLSNPPLPLYLSAVSFPAVPQLVSISLVSDTLWGLTASAARTWFARSDRRLSLIGGAGGFTMIGLGVTVAVTGRAD